MAGPGEAVNPHTDNISIHRNGTSSNSINEAVVNQHHTPTLKKTQPCILFQILKRFEIISTSNMARFRRIMGINSLTHLRNLSSRTRRSFILRGIFMCRKSELHWFYQDGASHVFPDAFEPYQQHIPADEQSALIPAYYSRLTSDDVNIRRNAAKEWTRWEMATSRLFPDPEYLDKAEDLDFAVAFAESNAIISSMESLLKTATFSTIRIQSNTFLQSLSRVDTTWFARSKVHGNCTSNYLTRSYISSQMQAIRWAKFRLRAPLSRLRIHCRSTLWRPSSVNESIREKEYVNSCPSEPVLASVWPSCSACQCR